MVVIVRLNLSASAIAMPSSGPSMFESKLKAGPILNLNECSGFCH